MVDRLGRHIANCSIMLVADWGLLVDNRNASYVRDPFTKTYRVVFSCCQKSEGFKPSVTHLTRILADDALDTSPMDERLCVSFTVSHIYLPMTGYTPGIKRRCALIDALHPALVRQRSPTKPRRTKTCFRRLGTDTQSSTAGQKMTKLAPAARTNAAATAAANIEPINCAEEETVQLGQASVLAMELPGESKENSALPTPSVRARRSSHPPSVAGPLLNSAEPAINTDEEGSVDIEELAAQAGRLTIEQWGSVEVWMARMRRILGADNWKCLGSGRSASYLRGHVRKLLLPGTIQLMPTKNAINAKAEHGRGVSDLEVCGVDAAKRDLRWGGLSGGWDDHLSQKVVFALEASLWMLAPQSQRMATVATIFRDRAQRYSFSSFHTRDSASPRPYYRSENKRSAIPGEAEGATGVRQTELGVSLLRVRKFVKTCKLVDGVTVLDADVDLALKWWEAIDRTQSDAAVSATAACTDALSNSRSTQKAQMPPLTKFLACADIASGIYPVPGSKVEQKSQGGEVRLRLCIAVGCSEAARYGTIGLASKAMYCRKHRLDGMTDTSPR